MGGGANIFIALKLSFKDENMKYSKLKVLMCLEYRHAVSPSL
jgi:hypothetical protein